ncbi:MAG: hypothetical protein AAB467_04760, partial [Patescibacteria group bacterium]
VMVPFCRTPLEAQKVTENIYKTGNLTAGKHILVAKVYDKAGNFMADSMEFSVAEINSPTINKLPDKLITGDILKVSGKTYPNSVVTVWSQYESADPVPVSVRSDANGNYSVVFPDKLSEGVYKVWSEVVREGGARSGIGEKVSIAVSQPALLQFGSTLISYLSVVVSLVSLILLLVVSIWYFGFRLRKLKSKLRRDIDQTSKILHEQFDALRYEILVQIEILEKVRKKRDLTKEEEKIVAQLRKHLDGAEVNIHKEFKHLEKDLE